MPPREDRMRNCWNLPELAAAAAAVKLVAMKHCDHSNPPPVVLLPKIRSVPVEEFDPNTTFAMRISSIWRWLVSWDLWNNKIR